MLIYIRKLSYIIKKVEDEVGGDAGTVGMSGSIRTRDIYKITDLLFFPQIMTKSHKELNLI